MRLVGPMLVVASLLVPAALASLGQPSLVTPSGMRPPRGLAIALADFFGDGKLEMVVQSDDGAVRVIAATGEILATLSPSNAGCTSSCYDFEGVSGPINPPAVSDVDKDGKLDLVVATTSAVVTRYELDPAASSTSHLAFTKVWERRFGDFGAWTMDAAPVLADLDGNGQIDTVVVTEENGVFAARPDGSLLWAANRPGGHATPAVRDLDGDGKVEVVVPRDDGVVDALNGASGSVKWSVNVGVNPGSIPAAPLLSDVNGDGRADVVVTARDAHDASNFANDHFVMLCYDSWGHLLWRFSPSWGAPMSHTRSVLVSVNGQRAILGADWNTIGHKPGNFERVGPGHVFLVSAAGRELWHRDLDTIDQSNKDLVVADAVGDGSQQVLVEGRLQGAEGLLMFDLATGASRGSLPTDAWTITRGAAAGDLFGDGRLGLVVPVAQGSTGGLLVYHASHALRADFPGWAAVAPPRNAPWTPGTPPPSGGNFSATFAVKGNEWWVEAAVASSAAVSGVSVTIDDGAPTDLPRTSWGAWARSLHAPEGSLLRFTARDASGATNVSGCYQWTAARAVDCAGGTPPPPPPPPPSNGTLAVTFTPKGNEWWVETTTRSDAVIVGVAASVDGGAAVDLPKTSWGSWARSIHAPSGSTVRLTARDANGATASACYRWTAATPTDCAGAPPPPPPPPPTSGEFSATFTPSKNGNEWWVETSVATSGGTLAGVDARVDGGAWASLSATSWGTWARSLHAPAGSSVEFRARDTAGHEAVSGAYAWPVR